MIFQSYNTVNILLNSTFDYFFGVYSKDFDIINALNSKSFKPEEIYSINMKIQNLGASNPLIRSIYLYNTQANTVFSYIVNDYSGISTIENFYDKDSSEILKNLNQYKNGVFIPRHAKYTPSINTYEENLITLIYSSTSGNKEQEDAMIINLNQDTLQSIVEYSKSGSQYKNLIIDKKGMVISDSDTAMINKDVSNSEYIREILETNSKEGSFNSVIDNKKSMVTYIKANSLGWIFIGVGQYDKLLLNITSMKNTIIILTVIFMLLGMITSSFFATNLYSPFYKLLRNIQERNKKLIKNQYMNEYSFIQTSFNELFDDVDKLKTNIVKLEDLKKEQFLSRILEGEVSYIIESENLEDNEAIKLNYQFSVVLVLKIDSFSDICENCWGNNTTLLKFSIINITRELLAYDFETEGIDNGVDYVTLIIRLKSQHEQQLDRIHNIVREVQNNITKYIKCTVTVGIGDIVTGIENIKISYDNVLRACDYRLILGKNSIIKETSLGTVNKTNEEYPYEYEKQIISSLKQMNINRFRSSIDEFFSIIKKFNIDEVQMAVMQLSMMIYRNLISEEEESVNSLNTNFKLIRWELEKLETIEEINNYLKLLGLNIIQIRSSNCDGNKKNKLVNKIKNYINENYNDSNLSIDMISDYVELSPNYIRTIFKDLVGTSISNFITDLRLNKAGYLLKNTDYTIKKIAELVGFLDNKYFYVLFKKYFNNTPDEYRSKVV
jgi:AraC-like DNA-binding protein